MDIRGAFVADRSTGHLCVGLILGALICPVKCRSLSLCPYHTARSFRKLCCSPLVRGMGEGSQVVKGCQWSQGEAQTEARHQGTDTQGPLKGLWSPKAPGHTSGGAFQRDTTPPSLGARQPVEVTQVSPIFWMSFTCPSRTWFCRKSQS